eukprot:982599-Pyramimonas_sp.AAC.1
MMKKDSGIEKWPALEREHHSERREQSDDPTRRPTMQRDHHLETPSTFGSLTNVQSARTQNRDVLQYMRCNLAGANIVVQST